MEPSIATICDNCGKTFSNVYTLNAHKRQVHENKKPYKCTSCTLAFSTKYKLNRHFQGIHNEIRDKFCEICGSSFKTREMLIKHHRTHFKGPFTCQICQEIFKYKASFDHHYLIKHERIKEVKQVKTVEKVRNYECKICFKNYKNLKSLQNHEENHTKGTDNSINTRKSQKLEVIDPLLCFVCNRNFDQKQDFELHLSTHEEEEYRIEDMIVEETFDNEIIDSTFINQSDQLEYLKEDSMSIIDYARIKEESPEKILVLEAEEPNVEIIVKSETNELQPYNNGNNKDDRKALEKIICDICGMLFMNKSHLRRHTARKHCDKSDFKFECDVCAAKFLLRYDLQRHMIKHNSTRDIECPQCKRQFKTKSSLDCHIKLIHNQNRNQLEKQFACNICSRSYFHKRHLDYHMRKHTDDRRYTCNKCDKSFLYSDAVKWHQIRIHKEPAPYICNLCSRKFIHEKTYESHMKEHDFETGSLSVACPVCNKKISEKRHLPRHIRTHLKKGFTCDFCHESFKERFQLTKHLLQCEDKQNKDVEVIYETVVE